MNDPEQLEDANPWVSLKYWAVAVVFAILGLGVTYLFYGEMIEAENEYIRAKFRAESEREFEALRRVFTRAVDSIEALDALYASSLQVPPSEFGSSRLTFKEFRRFSLRLLEQKPHIETLYWIPRVPAHRLKAFEKVASDALGLDYSVKSSGASKGERNRDYYPVFYAVRQSGLRKDQLGADWATDPRLLPVLKKAETSSDIVLSGPVKQGGEVHVVMLVSARFEPFEASLSPVIEIPADRLLGFSASSISVNRAVSLIQPLYAGELVIRILDSDGQQLYRTQHKHSWQLLSFNAEHQLGSPLKFERPLKVADRNWSVQLMPVPAFFERHGSETSLIILIAGSVLSLVVAGYLAFVLTRRQWVESVVETRTKELEESKEQLREAKEAAVDASEAKGRFLANMSHEIRTPMNAITGMTDLLLDSDLHDVQRRYVEQISRSVDALLGIINDILNLSKIEAGELQLTPEPIELRELIAETIRPLAARASDKDLELISVVEPDLPKKVRGVPGAIRQILVNLVSNAIKYTEDGEIKVNARLERRRESQARVLWSVSDTGPGIPKGQRKKIFEPFTQGDSNLTGTGLGLSIASELVERMGGDIWLESQLGEGSTFWFFLDFDILEESGDVRAPDGIPEGLRILVVDPREEYRTYLGRILQNWTFSTALAATGQEALRQLAEAEENGDGFDLMLMSSRMSDMEGLHLAEKIREEPGLEELPIVLLSTVGTPVDPERCERLKVHTGLHTPISESKLHDQIANVVGVGGMERGELATEKPDLGAMRILLAEDNLINQEVTVEMLESQGHSVDVAENGCEALRIWREQRPDLDLILMDLRMPDINGLEATTQIRGEEREDEHISIIALTAHAIEGAREEAFDAGMDGYLAKPLRQEQLYEALEEYAETRKFPEQGVEPIESE